MPAERQSGCSCLEKRGRMGACDGDDMHATDVNLLGKRFHALSSQNFAAAAIAAADGRHRRHAADRGRCDPGSSPSLSPQTHTSLERAHPCFWLVRPVQVATAAHHQELPLVVPTSPAAAAGQQQDMSTEQSAGQQQQARTTALGTRSRQSSSRNELVLEVLTRVLLLGASGAGSSGIGGGGGRPAGLPSVPCVSSRAGRSGGLGSGSARGGAGDQPLRSGGRVEAVRVEACYRDWPGPLGQRRRLDGMCAVVGGDKPVLRCVGGQ